MASVSTREYLPSISLVEMETETETETETEYDSTSDDPEKDPSFDLLEETRSRLSTISLKKNRVRSGSKTSLGLRKALDFGSDGEEDAGGVEVPQLSAKDAKTFEEIERMIKEGLLDKLKVDQCKVYLRKYGLRLTGNKDVLLGRIKEHLEVIDGGGERKYPLTSFTKNCQGDACMGDVVMFEQKVYEMFSIASRSATGPPCGIRTVVGRIVKESYGAAKQQHTFTIEVLWSKGEKPLPPLYPLLIKGRNLYRLKTLRQAWKNEEERRKVLLEKHSRGSLARTSRDIRIQQKEMKMNRRKRNNTKNNENLPPTINQLPSKSTNGVVPKHLQNSQQPHINGNHGNIPQVSLFPQVNQLPLRAEEHRGILHPHVPKNTLEQPNAPCSQQHSQFPAARLGEVTYKFHNVLPSILGPFPSQDIGLFAGRSEAGDRAIDKQKTREVSTGSTSECRPFSPPRLGNHDMHHRQKTREVSTGSAYECRPFSPPRSGNHDMHMIWYPPGHRLQNRLASPQRHQVRRQVCPYYHQGRCHFMDNCKFLHE